MCLPRAIAPVARGALAATALLAACAGAEAMSTAVPGAPAAPAAPGEPALGLHPGETMTFEVQLAGVLVGEAQLAVGELGTVDGHPALVVRSRAATAGAAALVRRISDESATVIDAETGRPLSVESQAALGDRRSSSSAVFRGRVATVTYRPGEAAPLVTAIDFREHALHDAHTAMAQLRAWRAPRGAAESVFVIGGKRLWRVDVTCVGEEAIGAGPESALGTRRAVVFEGKSYRARRDLTIESDRPARTFRVWLSDDADRVPLRVAAKTELGDIVMTLTDYARP